jgi:hypothetical protein
MIDEKSVLIGFDVSKAHLSWLLLNMSSTRIGLDEIHEVFMDSEPDLRGITIDMSEEFIKRAIRLIQSEEELLSSPLFQAAGMFSIDEPGWADKHDEYLAETYLEDHADSK